MIEDRPVREMDLYDEIWALKEYNVPAVIIERMHNKVAEHEEREKVRYRDKDETIARLQLQNSNLISVLNATGYYLRLHDGTIGEV